MRGERKSNTTISGASSANQRNDIQMMFRWFANDGPTLNLAWKLCEFQGFRTSITLKPCIFMIFQGGGPDPLPPFWIHPYYAQGNRAILVRLHKVGIVKGVKKVRSAIKLCSYYFSYNMSL